MDGEDESTESRMPMQDLIFLKTFQALKRLNVKALTAIRLMAARAVPQ